MNTLLIEVREEGVRAARVKDSEPVELYIFPTVSFEGAHFRARVAKVDPASNGAFLELGTAQAFMPFRKAKGKGESAKTISEVLHEGQMILVEWVNDAFEAGKFPVVKILSPAVKGPPGLEKEAPAPLEKALQLVSTADKVLIDNQVAYLRAKKSLSEQAELYTDKIPLLEAFGVEEKIEEALSGVIPLPCGGNCVIESTKAATLIDVNGGGAKPLIADLEAAKAIPAALRFQNIGGIIVVDFIGLKRANDRERVLKTLDAALKRDPVPVERTGFNRFGQLSLKRARLGLNLKARLKGFVR